MNLINILFLSIAMGIDCFVVSFSQGLIINSKKIKNSILLAITMGLFQGIMPCIGFLGANTIKSYVEMYSSIITFGIFMILGIKFIAEAFKPQEEKAKKCCIGFQCLITLGIATSIDALAAGGTLAFSNTKLLLPTILIGITSFIMSMCGFWIACCLHKISEKYLNIAGGLILIFLAFKC